MNVQKRIKRNLLGTAGDLPTSTWPPEWRRRTGAGFSGADLIYVSSNDTQRRYVYLYGEVEAAIEFDLPIDLLLTAEAGYQVRFLYQPTQRASENPRVVAYFNAGTHFWTRELQTSTANAAMEPPGDWLICDDRIDLNDENTQPKALLALQSGLFDPLAAAEATTGPERDQQVAQEPGWPLGPGELHFSGKALGTEVAPEMAEGVSVFVHLKPLALSTHEPKPEFGGARARYWVEKDGRSYMPICRGGGVHALILPVTADCGWVGAGIYTGTSAYASFTDQSEAGQAGLQVTPTDPDADDEAQPIAKAWEIRNDADEDDLSVNGRTATLRFESVYHADPYEALACIVGPYKLDITDHRQPDYWPSVEEGETLDLQVKVHYAVSGKPEPGAAVEWRHGSDLLETEFAGEGGWAVFSYQPTADATVTAVVDSPYKPEADTQAFVVKTIPTRLWAQFELSVDGTEISPDDHWWILPGQSYQLTLKPRAGSVLIGQDLALAVDPAQSLQLEPTGARPLAATGLTWRVTTAENASGAFALRLDCIRFKQPLIVNGTTNKLPALTIEEAPGDRLDPMAAVATLTALVPHYNGMLSTDEISVTWTGADGSPAEGSHTTSPVEVGTIGEKTIPLPVSLIAYSLGQSVTVSYTVIRDGTPLPASDALTLAVGVLPQSALEPSRPRIIEAAQDGNGAELDVGSLSGDAMVRVDSWPLIAHGQRTWLHVVGTNIDDSAYEKDLWRGSGNWVSVEWYNRGYGEKEIPYDDLLGLRHGSTLKLVFKASFNQNTDVDQATTFPLRTYTVTQELVRPTLDSVKDASNEEVSEGGLTLSTTLKLSGHASPGQTVEIYDGSGNTAEPKGQATADANTGIWTKEITVEIHACRLYAKALYPADSIYSTVRNLTVVPVVEPTLDSVKDADEVEIPGGGTTVSLTLKLSGHASKGQKVEIYDGSGAGAALKGEATADATTGIWTKDITVDVGDRRLYAKALYPVSPYYSNVRLLNVFDVRNLSAPSVKQATGATPNHQQLNPVAAKDALTVVIPDYGILPGDQVRVTWAGTAGAGSYTTPVQALPGSREIPVPVEVLAYNLGRSVTVTYTVSRGGSELSPSASLNLAVLRLAQSDLLGAKPKLLQAAAEGEGTELNLSTISGDVTCRVGIWPLIAPDQDVWLRLKGTKADGTVPYNLNIWAPPPRGPRASQVWIDQGFYQVSATYSYLKELMHGSTLTMEFKADLSKTTDEANAITFPLRTYTVSAMDLTAPSLKQGSGYSPYQALRPADGKDNLTVVIPDYGIQPGDRVSVTWAGTAGAGSHTTPEQALPPSREIPIPVSVIAFNLNKHVFITYTVTRGVTTSLPSDWDRIVVMAMNSGDLPDPLIVPARDQTLVLSSFTGNAQVTLAPWPLIAQGQLVTAFFDALWLGGVLRTEIYSGAVNASQVSAGLSMEIPRRDLEAVPIGALVKVEVALVFDPSEPSSEAVSPGPFHLLKA
ncbi:hypothetical protein [Pseudomonas gingeri]|uniref:Uncharacterized protein n=1 Tax=Pseudomonas gingeri TaxID=117681 RepID=A0A7Y8BKV4_9PSED|nr:hypothetical protein [Pseudomonas gingeri]NWB47546.1 hypothetical protein [Pseudomonas gingeri]